MPPSSPVSRFCLKLRTIQLAKHLNERKSLKNASLRLVEDRVKLLVIYNVLRCWRRVNGTVQRLDESQLKRRRMRQRRRYRSVQRIRIKHHHYVGI